ncbi:EpsG family protein [Vibrio parahaemolyticus]
MIDLSLLNKITPFLIIYLALFGFLILSLVSESSKFAIVAGLIFSVYFLSVFAGLRTDSVDPDFRVYRDIFESIVIDGDVSTHVEKGYLFLNWLFGLISDDFNVFLLLFTSLSLFIVAYSYYRFSYIPILSVILYFVHYYLGRDLIAIRSAMAYAIILFSVASFSLSFNNKKFFLRVIVAGFIHKTALLSLVVIPLRYIFDRFGFLRTMKFSISMMIFLLIFSPKIFLINIASAFYGSDSVIFIKYFESSDVLFDLGILNPINIKNMVLIYLGFRYFSDKEKFLLMIFSIFSFALIAFHDFGLLAARSLSQIIVLDTIFIANLCRKVKLEQRPIAVLLVLTYALFMLVINVSRPGAFFYESIL